MVDVDGDHAPLRPTDHFEQVLALVDEGHAPKEPRLAFAVGVGCGHLARIGLEVVLLHLDIEQVVAHGADGQTVLGAVDEAHLDPSPSSAGGLEAHLVYQDARGAGDVGPVEAVEHRVGVHEALVCFEVVGVDEVIDHEVVQLGKRAFHWRMRVLVVDVVDDAIVVGGNVELEELVECGHVKPFDDGYLSADRGENIKQPRSHRVSLSEESGRHFRRLAWSYAPADCFLGDR